MAANKLKSTLAVNMYDFDPDATAATAVDSTWLAMKDFENVLVSVMRSVGTGDLTSFVIQAATDSSGTGATTVATYTIGSQPDAVGDTVHLETDAAEIQGALSGATHVMAVIALATSTDECVVTITRGCGIGYDGLTSDVIA